MNRREFISSGAAGIAAATVCSNGMAEIILPAVNENNPLTGNRIDSPIEPGFLATPKILNMGFHYTIQFSTRYRKNVLGLIDQSTEEWNRWYYRTHEPEALRKMAEAGYQLIEIHFMYGFGIKSEKIEYDLTKKMVENAHRAGIRVNGYLQFFSVQKELFFYENPWAKDCLQIDLNGVPYNWGRTYNRPALCFSHKKVRDYYLKAIETGLTYCDLDGIRLDNDYYLGCYCSKCNMEFREYLKNRFSPQEARRIFGFKRLDAMDLVPKDLNSSGKIQDPLYAEMVKFRMQQRQKMMMLLHEKIISIKPHGMLGGNPGICRSPYDSLVHNLYLPDLGETHQLVCSENSLFPGITGESIRHQVKSYKAGQSNGFKVFPSHHLHKKEGGLRWPKNKEECALSLCEALAFGGHLPTTTWGIRMDGSEDKTLYERPHFMAALTPVKKFLERHEEIYRNADSAAETGIYLNRETHISDIHAYWYSLQGMIQLFLQNKIAFRFADTDDDEKLAGLKLLIIGNVRLVSDKQFERFRKFAETGKIILTGESCRYDEYFLLRDEKALNDLLGHKNVVRLGDCPERVRSGEVGYSGRNYNYIPNPPAGDKFIEKVLSCYEPPVKVSAIPFVAIDISKNERQELFIHVLNYDNSNPRDVVVELNQIVKTQVFSPEVIGIRSSESYNINGKTTVVLSELHTYAVIKVAQQ